MKGRQLSFLSHHGRLSLLGIHSLEVEDALRFCPEQVPALETALFLLWGPSSVLF